MVDRVPGVFDEKLCYSIKNSKVLVVGAGGIGCEILKNLVLTGFPNIDIIDLDTIDVSNLNRQFLFRKEHVGKSKAEVAKASALTFNPNVTITARRDSIISQDYGVNYFKQFSVVLSALDNRTARNHVNRMCLGADVPLVESGTAGYNGQVEVIKKGLTQCYECQPKAPQKTFPGCTIRNTPSEPIHCIVWAKHLFNQLFGEEDPDQDVSPDAADPENNAEDGTAEEPKISEDGNVVRQSTRSWAAENNYNPALVFNKLFHDDINYLLRMDNLWKSRAPPSPLHWDKLPEEEKTEHSGLPDQRLWSIRECAQIFATSVKSLEADLKGKADGDDLVWDKDDKAAMDFVAACANVRAYIFGIQRKSRFETKSMAGNIIPAIATANAIVAGLVVLRASAILQGSLQACTSVYLRRHANHQGHVCAAEKILAPPNPKCYVCSPKAQVTLQCDVDKLTLKDLDEALRTGLNMQAPDAAIEGAGVVVLSSEEGETEHNNEKTLFELGLRDSSVLSVDDFFQNFEIRVILQNDSTLERTWKVITDGSIPTPEPVDEKPTSNGSSNGTSEPQAGSSHTHVDSDDDMLLIEEEEEVVEKEEPEKKKKMGSKDESSESVAKRRRLDSGENCMIID